MLAIVACWPNYIHARVPHFDRTDTDTEGSPWSSGYATFCRRELHRRSSLFLSVSVPLLSLLAPFALVRARSAPIGARGQDEDGDRKLPVM